MLKKNIDANVVLNASKIELSLIDLVFMSVIFVVSILFVHDTTLFHYDQLSAILLLIFVFASLIYQLIRYGKISTMNWGIWMFMLIDIIPNIIFPYHYILKTLNFLFINMVLAYWFLSCANHRINGTSDWIIIDIIHAVLHIPFKLMKLTCQMIKDTIFVKKKFNLIVKIVTGVIISIPFLFVIIKLLSQTDNTFYFYMSLIQVDFKGIVEWLISLVFAITIFLYYSSMSYGNLSNQHVNLYDEAIEKNRLSKLSFVPQIIFTTMECLLVFTYLVFIIASIQSLLTTAGMSREIFSYAEYARQGFFELCIIAGINFGLLILIRLISKGKNAFSYGIEKILIIETLILILIVMAKLFMYIYVYDAFTYLRIYAGWFIIVLFGVFIILLLQKETSKFKVLPIVYYICFCFLLLNLMNVSYWVSDSSFYSSLILYRSI